MELIKLAINDIKTRMPELSLRLDEPLGRHCSFRIGGPVRALACPKSSEEAASLLTLLRGLGISPLIIGNGTNLLVTDAPIERIAVKTSDGMDEIRALGSYSLWAGAGVTLARLAVKARDMGLSGLEFAHGIPGTLGGAVCMNAGAYGGEIKDVAVRTVFLDGELNERCLEGASQGFGYRKSAFSSSNDFILGAELALKPDDGAIISERMSALAAKRRESQPLDMPSAGSTFKRPKSGYAAALIDEAGLKGYTIGGAMVSKKHAGFVINSGGATFDDVVRLIEHIKQTVLARSGIELEPEVKIITNEK